MTTGYLVAASARISYGVVRPGSALGRKNRRNVNAFLRFSAAFSRLGWDSELLIVAAAARCCGGFAAGAGTFTA
jgi:hypothetical protein